MCDVIDTYEIQETTNAYLLRTVYYSRNDKANTLEQHLRQEAFVQTHLSEQAMPLLDSHTKALFKKHATTEAISLIIPFLYGDVAADHSGLKALGMNDQSGLSYAKALIQDLDRQ